MVCRSRGPQPARLVQQNLPEPQSCPRQVSLPPLRIGLEGHASIAVVAIKPYEVAVRITEARRTAQKPVPGSGEADLLQFQHNEVIDQGEVGNADRLRVEIQAMPARNLIAFAQAVQPVVLL